MLYNAHTRADRRVSLGLKVDPNRPIYECPLCKVQAMQFYAIDGTGHTQRTDSFICRACGAAWQM
jgi:rubredoxin